MTSRGTIVSAAFAVFCAACQGGAPPPSDTSAIRVAVGIAGRGSGRVTSTPPGIDCPGACAATFPAGTNISLVAMPGPDSAFAGWTGECSGYASCNVARTTTLSASFSEATPMTIAPVATQTRGVRLNADPMRVFIRQWVKFQARVNGVPQPGVVWSVQEGERGGVISDDGTYTAPSSEGVYHAVATGRADPSKRGSITVQVLTTQEMYDYGGPLLPDPTVQLLWWGMAEQFGDAVDLFHRFLDGVNGSAWLAVLDQYLRGDHARVNFDGELFDDSPRPAGRTLDPAARICSVLVSNDVQPNPRTIYTLIVASGTGTFDYHTTAVCQGVQVPIIVLSLPHKGGAFAGACSDFVGPAERMLWAFSHELTETITDPQPVTAWADIFSQEIADGCVDATCQELLTGSFSLNPVYSNSTGGCAP